jgi:hypothetical protein
MKGVLPWFVHWVCHAGTRDFLFCLGCSSRPSTYFFSSPCSSFFPIVQQAGQAAVLDRLYLSMCLWWQVYTKPFFSMVSMTTKSQRKIGFLFSLDKLAWIRFFLSCFSAVSSSSLRWQLLYEAATDALYFTVLYVTCERKWLTRIKGDPPAGPNNIQEFDVILNKQLLL